MPTDAGSPTTENAGTAFVHIGTHKTGTSSFQRWAFENRVELASATGLEYYDGLFGANHYEIPMLCLRVDRNMPMRARYPDWCLDEWRRSAEAHIRDQVERREGPLLISSEALSYIRHSDEIERLSALLRPRRIVVLVVLREPAAYLRGYRQTLSNLGFALSSYRESFAYAQEDSWLVDYGSLLAVYRSAIGNERVIDLQYELLMQRHTSIIPGLLDALGFKPSQIPDWEGFRRNVTGSVPAQQKLRRRVRRLLG